MRIDSKVTVHQLERKLQRVFELSAEKLKSIEATWDPARGTPVHTVQGKYASRGWTEWTQGFLFGSSLLQFDAAGETWFLAHGRKGTLDHMAPHVSHIGVHDHGFNNVSTYGNLLRLIREGKVSAERADSQTCELALKCSGAVQAARWSATQDGRGFIYSFNGPHSLFADTIRSLRSLALAHRLGHLLMGEADRPISLLDRLVQHAGVTADYSVYYGKGRDAYDVRGRVAHESIFNPNDGNYRCPNSQQGYSPFTTWTRGLAWIMCGFAEQLEFMRSLPEEQLESSGSRKTVMDKMLEAAEATCDFYIDNTPADGVPYWDTGAPGLTMLRDYLDRPAEPFNDFEPVDSSAAAIAAQGLWRLGKYLLEEGRTSEGERFCRAALTVALTLFDAPYLSEDPQHQGLLLHSVYHRPNGWDYVPPGRKVPCGESSMWGDYHARELALLLLGEIEGRKYLTFFSAA
jgi:unsaturated chondroitin disaccharide hydrolase